MILPDVNVLIHAFRADAPRHGQVKAWLEGVVNGDERYGVAEPVVSGFLRVVTDPRIYVHPTRLDEALDFAEQLMEPAHCTRVRPGPRHWSIFTRLCTEAHARGALVADAYLAAIAIEQGCEWITFDRDFARFHGLRWRPPV